MKKVIFAGCIVLSLISISKISFAECIEYKIIDHGDRVEAVCIGEPMSDAERERMRQENMRRDQELAAQRQAQKTAYEQEEIQRKLSKVNCTGQPGECGPGRVCMMFYGLCKEKDDAQRIINQVRTGLQESDRQFKETQRDWENKRRNDELNDKLDKLDRKIKTRY
jgi:hypothetical protein